MSNIYSEKYIDALYGNSPIHWSTKFGKNVRLGVNVVIEKNCIIGDNTFIGHNTVLRPNTVIGKDCVIGHLTVFEGDAIIHDRVLIHAQCNITKNTLIESDVFIAALFCSANTEKIVHGRNYELKISGPTIRRAARLGVGVLMLPGLEIGENAQVGAGSLVTENVPAGQIWFGVPFRYIKNVPVDELL